jgi:predicted ATPase
LAIRLGDERHGIEIVQGCLDKLRAAHYEFLTTPFNISLVQGLAAIGRLAEAKTLLDETVRLVEDNGDFCYMPELLRVRGGLLLSLPEPRADDAKASYVEALEMSRRQGALAWELRAAVDLAALLALQGDPERARTLLQPVFDRFAEGSDTANLKAAQRLLATLE